MLFYRIENEKKRGCYVGNNGMICNMATREHPSPYDDSLLYKEVNGKRPDFFGGEWRFGFESETQFRAWFFDNNELTVMAEHGFKMSVYDVPKNKVVRGYCQCIMSREYHFDEYLKESKSLTDYIKHTLDKQ